MGRSPSHLSGSHAEAQALLILAASGTERAAHGPHEVPRRKLALLGRARPADIPDSLRAFPHCAGFNRTAACCARRLLEVPRHTRQVRKQRPYPKEDHRDKWLGREPAAADSGVVFG